MTNTKLYDIILRPIRSEKAFDGIATKKYTFEVARGANKVEIKNAVEQIFKVKVEKVNTINCRGKLKRQGRTEGYTNDYKKAIVQLTEESDAIRFFEGLA